MSIDLEKIALSTFNEDWLGWADAPGGEQFEAGLGAQIDSMQDAGASWIEIVDALGCEDVDFAQAQMVRECAEASWYRFCAR